MDRLHLKLSRFVLSLILIVGLLTLEFWAMLSVRGCMNITQMGILDCFLLVVCCILFLLIAVTAVFGICIFVVALNLIFLNTWK